MSDIDDLKELQKLQEMTQRIRQMFVPLREKIEKHFQVPEDMEGEILKVLEFEGRKMLKIKSGIFEITIKTK